MSVEHTLQPGMKAEQEFVVQEQHSAGHVGSGSLRVLATPSMIGFMERVARDLMEANLPEGSSSVGAHVDVRHLAATPIGSRLRAACEIIEIEGRRVDFLVEAWDEVEKVGEGRHTRYVIDIARFLKRLESKLPAAKP